MSLFFTRMYAVSLERLCLWLVLPVHLAIRGEKITGNTGTVI